MDIHLKAKHIFVRAGEFFIGSEENPFTNKATITLFGEQKDETILMDGAVEAGNKVLANVGDVRFFGVDRSRMARLKAPAAVGSLYIIVETGLDWVAGDQIYLAPTGYDYLASDYATVVNYDIGTGRVDLDVALKFYHFGAVSSTGGNYNGLDMRGEVVLLTRNIRIGGDPYDAWGGHVVTSDTIEPDGTYRSGHLFFNNVEITGCSQRNTFKSALRFEGAIGRYSEVHNTVIHKGLAWGLYIASSSNILVKNTSTIGFKAVATNLISTQNVTVDGLFAADVRSRKVSSLDQYVDKESCVAICSYFEPNSCFDTSVINSIAAGCMFGGFMAPGHRCGEAAT